MPNYEALLRIAMGAVAYIARADDMTETQRRHKADRIYKELSLDLQPGHDCADHEGACGE